jgi:sugar O-acyltransferase (sialic acid O-acetyltransferase NeuD family)
MELHIEKINVSDNKFLITKLHVQNGDAVNEGDLIYSIESSKASKDVVAPSAGFIFFANGVKEFDEYPAGFLIAQIVETNENPFALASAEVKNEVTTAVSDKEEIHVTATKEALALAAKLNVDLSKIDAEYITKWDVLEYVKRQDIGTFGYKSTIKRVAMIGAGRGAVQILDLISHLDDYTAAVIYDDTDEKQGMNVYGTPIVGKVDFDNIALDYQAGRFDYIVNAVSVSNEFRKRCFDELSQRGVPYCNLIHPSCVIGQYVTMGTGNILFPFGHIGPNTIIGNDCFFTAKVSIEHHNVVGSHCTCGPCLMTSGSVNIGDCTKFGTGVFVEPLIEIGSNSLIASGTIITNNVPDNTIVRHQQNLEYVERNTHKRNIINNNSQLGGG